jgi:sucrose phosphorylase
MTWVHREERVMLDAALDTATATLTWTEQGAERTAALGQLP